MRIILAWLALTGLGCALPKVALGGRVALGHSSTGEPGASRSTVRSALWIAIVYAAQAAPAERPQGPAAAQPFAEREPEPCAIDVACAWEREATYQSWIEQGEPSP